jgi:hypothetical protein
MRIVGITHLVTVALLLAMPIACGKKSDDDSDDDDSGEVGGNGGGSGGSGSDQQIGSLALSDVFSVDVPDSVAGNGTASSLKLAGTKSFEACELRTKVREGLSTLSEVGTNFCMIESNKNLVFGTKYNISFGDVAGGADGGGPPGDAGGPPGGDPGGPPMLTTQDAGFPESMQIWVDNAKFASDQELTVYLCMDQSLQEVIKLKKDANDNIKGRVYSKGGMDLGQVSMDWHRTVFFDKNFTTAGETKISIKEALGFSSDQFGDESARRFMNLTLDESGVSKVLSSYAGSQQGTTTNFSSAGSFSDAFGAVIAKSSVTMQGETDPISFSNKSFFDGQSNVVQLSANAEGFGDGGNLYLAAANVPQPLPADFKPDDFPADAWDCSGTEDLEMDLSGEGPAACFEDWDGIPEQDCAGADFAQGMEFEINEDDLPPPESFEEDFDFEEPAP